jgi:hypothetical protein
MCMSRCRVSRLYCLASRSVPQLIHAEQSVQPEPRAARFLKYRLVGRGPVDRGVRLDINSQDDSWKTLSQQLV